VIASRKLENLQSVAARLNAEHATTGDGRARVTAVPCNIRREDEVRCDPILQSPQVRHLIDTTLGVYGRLDYLVNNGGGQFPQPLADMSLKGWNAVVETNLTGTFLVCREGASIDNGVTIGQCSTSTCARTAAASSQSSRTCGRAGR